MRSTLLCIMILGALTRPVFAQTQLSAVWANTGEDKITQDELRATQDPQSVLNSVWDDSTVSLFGAKNEVIAFNVILEAAKQTASQITVTFDQLIGPNNDVIGSTSTDLFNWVNKNIELFYIRYLQIKGLSVLSYESYYDERHAPKRFRRPYDSEYFIGIGGWEDRPDHDKFYPDIAVPLELQQNFIIQQGNNQSIWVDIFIPKSVSTGLYSGNVIIHENGQLTHQIPVELEVFNFELPAMPSAKTMIFLENGDIETRYAPSNNSEGIEIRDRHFLMAHRHKFSLIDHGYNDETNHPEDEWLPRLDGSLFTSINGYDGPGIGTGNNIFSIGTYSAWQWSWDAEDSTNIRAHADGWVKWFQDHSSTTEYFLYLIDESDDYDQINQWLGWLHENPNLGKDLPALVTVPLLNAYQNIPHIDIPCTGYGPGNTPDWEEAYAYFKNSGQKIYSYNGGRPYDGSFSTEDDGVALRVNGWAQYKFQFDRWFYWAATYYNDFQGGRGQTNVFQNAHTFGGLSGFDPIKGETGWNHNNGDGVLFYPGTDAIYTEESYNVSGPFASLRLKHWRRGIQDADYLTLAEKINPTRVHELVEEMIPKILWEYGVDAIDDPTWVRTDISWSTNPDVWEAARRGLAEMIAKATSVSNQDNQIQSCRLFQNFPNPFNQQTAISYQLSVVSRVKVRVFDILGHEIAVLVNEKQSAGDYRIVWDAASMASGLYLCRIEDSEFKQIIRMVLLK